jgi:ubiquinone/menaquinone biosynthesis C-methylase UbiE
MSAESQKIRRQLLDDYYASFYDSYLFDKDLLGFGIKYFERGIDQCLRGSFCKRKRIRPLHQAKVLEIGGGDGQHLPYVRFKPESYTLLDIRKLTPENLEKNLAKCPYVKEVAFVLGDAANMPFGDQEFDLVIGTCVLHHVDDVLGVLMEAKRVCKGGGEIVFILPTDPGLLNGLVKRLISFRKLKLIGHPNPKLIYSLDHKNYINSIISQFSFVFDSNTVTK